VHNSWGPDQGYTVDARIDGVVAQSIRPHTDRTGTGRVGVALTGTQNIAITSRHEIDLHHIQGKPLLVMDHCLRLYFPVVGTHLDGVIGLVGQWRQDQSRPRLIGWNRDERNSHRIGPGPTKIRIDQVRSCNTRREICVIDASRLTFDCRIVERHDHGGVTRIEDRETDSRQSIGDRCAICFEDRDPGLPRIVPIRSHGPSRHRADIHGYLVVPLIFSKELDSLPGSEKLAVETCEDVVRRWNSC